jgi:hypothetical protein
MSIEKTKKNLMQLIADDGNRVIALAGKWGTGKSHLWGSIRRETGVQAAKDALYVSLFGIKDIAQLKIKLVQGALADPKSSGKVLQKINETWQRWSKTIRAVKANAGDVIDELALLSVPKMLSERFIVIDDIERKHDKLDVSEVMAFIDEYTQLYKARFFLILNSDQLKDKTEWETLREKVIDHEVSLKTTAEEAFDIALQSNQSRYAEPIRESVKICDITNIRIIQKIVRAVNNLLADRMDLNEGVIKRVVPSTVLLGAIHYKGIVDGPDIDYVLALNARSVRISMSGSRSELNPEDELRQRHWKTLMQSLGIHSSDDYERLVVEFLRSGLLDADERSKILDRYMSEKGTLDAQQLGRAVFDRSLWSLNLSDEELLSEVAALLPHVHLLDIFLMSKIYTIANDLPGGQDIASQVADNWLQYFLQKDHSHFNFTAFLQHDLPPAIKQQFATMASRKIEEKKLPSLVEVCFKIAENNGWGDDESEVMQKVTASEFEAEIKRRVDDDLRLLMLQSAYMFVHRVGYTDLANGLWSFIAACRKICHEDPASRLSKTIVEVFREHRIQSLLVVFDRPSPPTTDAMALPNEPS